MKAESVNASNLATTMTTDVLTPASSVREVGGRLPNPDRRRAVSRRLSVGKDANEGTVSSEIVDIPEHRIDRIG